ncbi:MAG: GNAT family N-acetyltransferase [Anaerolineaceae bacterium]|nr:GNAT family N-acetyltransferase [Anaerolineaceae bacterium]
MTKMKITKGREEDWPALKAIDASSLTDYSYKMEINRGSGIYGFTLTRFRLPRSLPLIYPKNGEELARSFTECAAVLVGNIQNEPIAYACLEEGLYPDTAQVTDLVVMNGARQNGIGTILLVAAEKWAAQRKRNRLFMAIPLRNDPMISLAKKLGYSFCGFMSTCFKTGEDAIFYEKRLG